MEILTSCLKTFLQSELCSLPFWLEDLIKLLFIYLFDTFLYKSFEKGRSRIYSYLGENNVSTLQGAIHS